MSDLDDLMAARRGNHEAGRNLVSRHGSSMVKTAWRVLGRYGDSDAEDAVQESFVAALSTTALPTGDVGAWLRSIVVRKALDSVRSKGRRSEESLPEEHPHREQPRMEVLAVRQGLARLSATDRAVVTLVDLEGRSMAEAAESLGVTRMAVKWRAVRARRRLAGLLAGGRKAHG